MPLLQSTKMPVYARFALLITLSSLVCAHAYYVFQIPDIPYWDEWDLILTTNLPQLLNFSDLFKTHNEHLIVFTRLLVKIFYQLNDLNFAYLSRFSFLCYLGAIVGAYWYFRQLLDNKVILCICILPFFSTLAIENLAWGMQSCIHISIGFFIYAWIIFFRNQSTFRGRALHAILLFFSAISFAAGFGYLIAANFVVLALQIGLFGNKFRNWKLNSFSLALLSFFTLLTFSIIGPHKLSRPALDMLALIKHYAALYSQGFGLTGTGRFEDIFGFLLFVLSIGLFLHFYISQRRQNLERVVLIFAWMLSAMLSLLLISYGRFEYGVAQAKSSRYAELALLIWPAYFYVLSQTILKFRKQWIVALILIINFALFFDRWKISDYKSDHISRRLDGIQCLVEAKQADGSWLCAGLYPNDLQVYIERSKQLHINFSTDL